VAYKTKRQSLSLRVADEILGSRNERKSRCTRRRRRRRRRSRELSYVRTYSENDARVCAELVLRIVQNTRNNLWTGHDDDWNIYSARYARCTLYDGIFVAAGVPAAARSSITMPYFKHDPPQERDGSVLFRNDGYCHQRLRVT